MHSPRPGPLAVVALGLYCAAAQADVPFPGRGRLERLPVRLRYDTREAYPGYDFYVWYGRGPGDPGASMQLVPVTPAAVHVLPGQGPRLTELRFLAVPHRQTPHAPARRGHLPPDAAPGELWSATVPLGPGGLDTGWAGYAARYEVTLGDGRLDVTPLPPACAAPAEWWAARLVEWLPPAVLLAATALVFGRPWRRRRPPLPLPDQGAGRPAQRSASPEPDSRSALGGLVLAVVAPFVVMAFFVVSAQAIAAWHLWLGGAASLTVGARGVWLLPLPWGVRLGVAVLYVPVMVGALVWFVFFCLFGG